MMDETGGCAYLSPIHRAHHVAHGVAMGCNVLHLRCRETERFRWPQRDNGSLGESPRRPQCIVHTVSPMALPWAAMFCTFGAGKRNVSSAPKGRKIKAHGNAMGDMVCTMLGGLVFLSAQSCLHLSIPQISFVKRHLVGVQHQQVFFLKRLRPVMFLLVCNVSIYYFDVSFTNGEHPITDLPGEVPKFRSACLDPFRRSFFDFFHHVCDRQRSRKS